ncbi:MAG: serine/threonine protein kinase [Bdellovibrionales bacterium]
MSKEDFYDLTPDDVMNAVEQAGFLPTGPFTQLNSYENRVFDIRCENSERVIAKFYRPGRWSKKCILEEHEFLNDLKKEEMPVLAPLLLKNNSTLDSINDIFFGLWPKSQGRMVDELILSDFKNLGGTLARFHNVGAQKSAPARPLFNVENYGWNNLEILENWIAPEVSGRYLEAAADILEFLEARLDKSMENTPPIRIHGDCHRGNILKTDHRGEHPSEFYFVDFDDCCMGHPVQDLWMLLSDDESTPTGSEELNALMTGYQEFRNFDETALKWIPALRGLRIVHYAAWIARRWEDPSFQRLFPQYTDYNYWASETEALEALKYSLAP